MKKRRQRGLVIFSIAACVFLLSALLMSFFGSSHAHSVSQARLNELKEAYRGRTYNYMLVDWGPASYSEVVGNVDMIVIGTVSSEPETFYMGMFKWFKFGFQTEEVPYTAVGKAVEGEEITVRLPSIDYGAKKLFIPGTKLLMLLKITDDFDEDGIYGGGVTHTFYLTEDDALYAMLSHQITSDFNGWYLKSFKKYIKDLEIEKFHN